MKYMGSKNRFAKELLPIILKDRVDGQYYVEPFAGGMNMIDKVTGNRIANDNNTYLIELWKGLTNGEVGVTDISKEYYSEVRDSFNLQDGKFSDFTIGWVGFMGSANGRFRYFSIGVHGEHGGEYYDDLLLQELKKIVRRALHNKSSFDVRITSERKHRSISEGLLEFDYQGNVMYTYDTSKSNRKYLDTFIRSIGKDIEKYY